MRAVLLLVAGALLPTQGGGGRELDLTGKPDAVIGETLSLVSGVREIAGNRVIVTDQMDHSIFVANFAANTLRPVGRQGEGPGEYRFPTAPLAGAGDTTWVYDATLRRLLQIAPDASITASIGIAAAGIPGGVLGARGSDRVGRIYFEGSSFDPERGTFTDTVAISRWRPRGAAAEVVARISTGGRVIFKRPNGNTSMARAITPFPHLDAWAALPGGGVAVVRHAPFRIDLVDSAGVTRQGAPIADVPLPVTGADRDAYRERMALVRSSAAMKSGGAGPGAPRIEIGDDEFPATMPPFIATAVLATPEGELWIGRSHAAADTTWRYDIFSTQGRRLGAVRLATTAAIVGFGRGTVYIARVDPADDLVHLERYRR